VLAAADCIIGFEGGATNPEPEAEGDARRPVNAGLGRVGVAATADTEVQKARSLFMDAVSD
jgi:hypothetical protein